MGVRRPGVDPRIARTIVEPQVGSRVPQTRVWRVGLLTLLPSRNSENFSTDLSNSTLLQTLSLRQLEPHCVNPATSIRITNKLSLTRINYRATLSFDSSRSFSIEFQRPAATRAAQRFRPLLCSSSPSLCFPGTPC